MSAFRDIMSIVDPTAPKTTPTPRPAALSAAPKSAPRPTTITNGTDSVPQLKRKASGPVDSNQVKLPRKDVPGQAAQTNGGSRPIAKPGVTKPNLPAPISTTPYRGTAAPAGTKVASPVVRRPTTPATTVAVVPKASAAAPKPTSSASTAAVPTSAAPKKGYLALLQKAKEKDLTKPVAPPVQSAPAKILTRKERLALKAEASAVAKGKKPASTAPGRQVDTKGDSSKEKKKSNDVGYQGTARPSKPPVQVGYKGTARPSSAPASTSRGGTPTAKQKSKLAKNRNDGYADWSDLDEMEDDEEEDYESDGSSDMEGGMWDVEEEEQKALKAAKKEDAEALAEEMRLKREKEERKRKLLAMSKAAASKRKY